jgi:hypothetical protein
MYLLIEVIGWSGALLILSGYIANSNGWLTARDWRYQLINLVGSAEFVLYTAMHQTWATMTLNGIWCAVAVTALLRMRGRAVAEA